MATNGYFNNFNHARFQRLHEDLLLESIKTWGVDVHYIPRNTANLDLLFGEDPAGNFTRAAPIEVYIKSVDGYEGDGHFMAKFGLEVRDSITFQMAKRRFLQIKTNKLLMESGYVLQLESANLDVPESSSALILETDEEDPFQIDFDRPRAGDILFFPFNNKFFEISYVNDDELFFPLGNSPMYTIECNLFEFSHEKFDTGVTDIDDIALSFDGNMLNYRLMKEDGGALLSEDGDNIILETYNIEDSDPQANNNLYKILSNDVVDFSDVSPFVKLDVNRRW